MLLVVGVFLIFFGGYLLSSVPPNAPLEIVIQMAWFGVIITLIGSLIILLYIVRYRGRTK